MIKIEHYQMLQKEMLAHDYCVSTDVPKASTTNSRQEPSEILIF